MTEGPTALICRFCQGISYAPGSTCPHCGREVMAICPRCKAYVDNRLASCDQCSTPLVAIGDVARALGAAGAQVVADPPLPPPPRALTTEQWRDIAKQPVALAGVALATFILIEAALLRGSAGDPSGITAALAVAAVLYPALALTGAWRTLSFRRRLLRGGLAVRGRLTVVEGRRPEHRLAQVVKFAFLDARGQERSGLATPFSGLDDLAAGDEITVLYLPDDPASCAVYPFLL